MARAARSDVARIVGRGQLSREAPVLHAMSESACLAARSIRFTSAISTWRARRRRRSISTSSGSCRRACRRIGVRRTPRPRIGSPWWRSPLRRNDGVPGLRPGDGRHGPSYTAATLDRLAVARRGISGRSASSSAPTRSRTSRPGRTTRACSTGVTSSWSRGRDARRRRDCGRRCRRSPADGLRRRPLPDARAAAQPSILLVDAPTSPVSSTDVRAAIASGRVARGVGAGRRSPTTSRGTGCTSIARTGS